MKKIPETAMPLSNLAFAQKNDRSTELPFYPIPPERPVQLSYSFHAAWTRDLVNLFARVTPSSNQNALTRQLADSGLKTH